MAPKNTKENQLMQKLYEMLKDMSFYILTAEADRDSVNITYSLRRIVNEQNRTAPLSYEDLAGFQNVVDDFFDQPHATDHNHRNIRIMGYHGTDTMIVKLARI